MVIIKKISLVEQNLVIVFKMFTTKEGIKKLYSVSLYRNAVYLMLDAVIPGLSGFVFWVIAARLYSTQNIGIVSAAISANGLLVSFSTLGLTHTIVRFLPDAKEHATEMINSTFTVGGLVSLAAGFIFVAGLHFWSPALISVRNDPVFFIMFIIFVPVNLLENLCGVVFIARRRSDLMLFQDIIASLIRFIPLFLLAIVFANYGVFASWGLAILTATVIGILIFIPITQKGYKPLLYINKKIFGEMFKFSISNYLVSLLSIASSSILPLMVLNRLGAEKNAYFYISWTISSIIATVPSAITTSLFAEGVNDEKTLNIHIKRTITFILLLLVPLLVIILLFSKWLLLIFGAKYSQNAATLLQILAITALPLSISALYITIKRIQKSMKSVVVLTGFIAVVVLTISYVLLPRIGLLGAGIGWLSGNTAAALIIVIIWVRKKSVI